MKKFISTVATFLLAVSSMVLPFETSAESSVQVGDVNLDGQVDVIDVLLLKKYVLGIYDIEGLPSFEVKEDDSSTTTTENGELIILSGTSVASEVQYDSLSYEYTSREIADLNNDGHLEMAVKYTDTYDDLASYQIHTIWKFYNVDDYGTVNEYDTFIKLGGSYPTAGTWYDEANDEYKFVIYQWKMGNYAYAVDIDDFSTTTIAGSEYYEYNASGNGAEYGEDFTYSIDGVEVSPSTFESYMMNIYEGIVDPDRGCYYLHDGVIEVL